MNLLESADCNYTTFSLLLSVKRLIKPLLYCPLLKTIWLFLSGDYIKLVSDVSFFFSIGFIKTLFNLISCSVTLFLNIRPPCKACAQSELQGFLRGAAKNTGMIQWPKLLLLWPKGSLNSHMDGRFHRSGIIVWRCFQQWFPTFSDQKKPYSPHKNPLLCSISFHFNWMLINSINYMKEDLVTMLFHTVKMPLFGYFFVQTTICTAEAFSGSYSLLFATALANNFNCLGYFETIGLQFQLFVVTFS